MGQTCPLCRDTITGDGRTSLAVCPQCETVYHDECYQEMGRGCVTLGCSYSAASDPRRNQVRDQENLRWRRTPRYHPPQRPMQTNRVIWIVLFCITILPTFGCGMCGLTVFGEGLERMMSGGLDAHETIGAGVFFMAISAGWAWICIKRAFPRNT